MLSTTVYLGFKCYHICVKDQGNGEVTSKGTPGGPPG